MPYYPPAASAGTPGGSNTQVQFNDSGAFGGDAGLTYNKTSDTLTVGVEVKTYYVTGLGSRRWACDDDNGFMLGLNRMLKFGSANDCYGGSDTGLGRNAAGVLEINNTGLGTFRDLKLRNLIGTGYLTLDGTSVSSASGTLSLGGVTRTTIGANGAASALTANPLGYIDAYIGSTAVQIPFYTRGA